MSQSKYATQQSISEYWRSLANTYKLINPNWYQTERNFHRVIWMECSEIVKATNYSCFINRQPSELLELDDLRIATNLRTIWQATGSMIIQSVLQIHKGEFELRQVDVFAKQIAEFWDGSINDSHFFDYLETIVVDACANQQINVTCFRAICDRINLNLEQLCGPVTNHNNIIDPRSVN